MARIGCLHEALSALGEVVAFVKAINACISYVSGSTSMLAKTGKIETLRIRAEEAPPISSRSARFLSEPIDSHFMAMFVQSLDSAMWHQCHT
jgi:hypothetical protein